MTEHITPGAADAAIFAGDFDHWAGISRDEDPVVECGVPDCDFRERGYADHHQAAFAYRLHVSKRHMGDVVAALEGRS